MKTLIVLVALLAATTSMAEPDYQDKAEKLFDGMSASEAAASNKFSKRSWNQNMPGTSTWFSPSSLCLEGNTLNTVNPVEVCTEWTLDLKNTSFGKKTKTFTNKSMANRAEDSSNAKGKLYCTDSFYKEVSTPLNWTEEGCVLWGVKTESNSVKTFKYESQADRYADDSSKAKGNPFCMEAGMVSKSVSSTYKMDFYRKTASNKYDGDKFLGTHTYSYQSCGGDDLPPVNAN